jgi:hypothetical protein
MYRVMVDDNFHFMDESERTTAGDFDTLEAAHECCRKIVEESLDHLRQQGMTAEELREAWGHFGDDPFVRVPPGGPPSTFSACDYAKRRASEMCGISPPPLPDAPPTLTRNEPGPNLKERVKQNPEKEKTAEDGLTEFYRKAEVIETLKKPPRRPPPKPPYEPKDEQPAPSKTAPGNSEDRLRAMIKFGVKMAEAGARRMLALKTQRVWSKMGRSGPPPDSGAGWRNQRAISDLPEPSGTKITAEPPQEGRGALLCLVGNVDP